MSNEPSGTPRRTVRVVLAGTLAALALIVTTTEPAAADGDASAGETVFRKCAVCHTVELGKHKIGPGLLGVVGRTPGTAEGFKYSGAMKSFGEAGQVWNEAALDSYLTNPRAVVKGTRMAFPGLKDTADRDNVIAYLKSLSQ